MHRIASWKDRSVETERLNLIPVSQAHIQDIFHHFAPEIARYMVPLAAAGIDETAAVVQRFIAQRECGANYVYAVTGTLHGAFMGIVSLDHIPDPIPELGIWIAAPYHGNHFGREAIGGILHLARSMGIKRLCYPVDRRNTPSKKIPLYYGGKLVSGPKEIITARGKILEEERMKFCYNCYFFPITRPAPFIAKSGSSYHTWEEPLLY
mgnify:CR=1 FL=1